MPHLVCYAMKANSNLRSRACCRWAPAWTSCRAASTAGRAAGVPGDRIVFSGVGKTAHRDAPGARGRRPPVQRRESEPELGRSPRSRAPLARAPVAIRINPDVDARTHAKIATGNKNKFGMPIARARAAYAEARAAGHRGRRRRRAHRLAADRARPLRVRLRQGGRTGRALRADATTSAGSTSAAASASPTAGRTRRRRCPPTTARSCAAPSATSAARSRSSPAG